MFLPKCVKLASCRQTVQILQSGNQQLEVRVLQKEHQQSTTGILSTHLQDLD